MNTRVKMSPNGKFIYVEAIPQQSHLVRNIPTARWGKTAKMWVIKPSRAAWNTLLSLPGVELDAAAQALAQESSADPPPEIPWPVWYRHKTQPFPHQNAGSAKVYGRRESYLDADPGLGKTKMMIDAYAAKFASGSIDRVIVFCPKTVRRVWTKEMEKHCPIPYRIEMLKNGRKNSELVFNGKVLPMLLVSTEGMSTMGTFNESAKFMANSRAGVIVDEAHMIKNFKAVRTKNITKITSMCESVTLASGTMTGNGIEDIYSQFYAMNPDIIGYPDFRSFCDRYCVMGGYKNKKIVGYKNLEELLKAIRPYISSARMADLDFLLPKVSSPRYIEMGRIQKAKYDELASKMRLVEDNIETKNSLDLMSRLHQISGGFLPIIEKRKSIDENGEEVEQAVTVGFEHIDDSKIVELMQIAENHPNQSIIIWCCYRHEIDLVVKALADKYGPDSVTQMHGDLDENQRADSIDSLQSGKTRFMVGTQTSGGVGTTMTAATVVVYYSNNFSYINRKQSEDRSYRIGQTKQVVIIDLIAEDSIDELIQQAIANKTDLAKWITMNPDSLNIFGTFRV